MAEVVDSLRRTRTLWGSSAALYAGGAALAFTAALLTDERFPLATVSILACIAAVLSAIHAVSYRGRLAAADRNLMIDKRHLEMVAQRASEFVDRFPPEADEPWLMGRDERLEFELAVRDADAAIRFAEAALGLR